MQRFTLQLRSRLSRIFLCLLAGSLPCFLPVYAQSEVVKNSVPKRVIALGGDITEIVFSLGASQRLVGVDSTSTYPLQAKDKPVLGYLRALNAEGILAQNPDLILASADAGPPFVFKRLEEAGVPVIRMPSIKASHEDVTDLVSQKIMMVAGALHLKNKGQIMAAKFKKAMQESKKRVRDRLQASMKKKQGRQGHPRLLFVLSLRDGAPMAAGRKTAADVIITLAGGKNVFNQYEGYKLLSLEAAVATHPDAIAMMEHTLTQAGGVDAVAQLPAIAATPAGKNKHIVTMEGNELLSFGPRLPEALDHFSAMIFGDNRAQENSQKEKTALPLERREHDNSQ